MIAKDGSHSSLGFLPKDLVERSILLDSALLEPLRGRQGLRER